MAQKTRDSLVYWVAINLVPLLEPGAVNALVDHFGGAREAWEADKRALDACAAATVTAKGHLLEARKAGLGAASAELERAAGMGVEVVCRDSAGYPESLKTIDVPPPVLYIKGKMPESGRLHIAIVGTRRCTAYGRDVAEELGRGLCRAGAVVVSGLAMGIDSHAHRGALEGGGPTVAVLGSGLNNIYPAINSKLAEDVAERGALLSEFPLGMGPQQWNFPRRNRVVSGLSAGVVVVEAPDGSGALITVNYALEQGKEVFAVPGNVKSRLSKGAHRLLRDGACLVEGVEDVLAEFKVAPRQEEFAFVPKLEGVEGLLFEAISGEPSDFDGLCRGAGCGASEAAAALTMLEMKGLIRQLPGRMFVRHA